MATTKKSTTKKKNVRARKTPAKSKKTTSARTTTKKVTAKRKSTKRKTIKKKASVSKTSKSSTMQQTDGQKLNFWNWTAAIGHVASGIAIIMLSNSVFRGVHTNFLTRDPIASTEANSVLAQATRSLFDVNIVYLLAAGFFIAAIYHILVATTYKKDYESSIKSGINKYRWMEFGLSTGVMLVTIGLLTGVSDISVLSTMFAAALLSALVMLAIELNGDATKKTGKFGHILATILALIPWVLLKLNFLGTYKYGDGGLETYNYWIIGTTFVLSAALVMAVHRYYTNKEFFADYMNTEMTYMILSFAAKSALAWQVYVALLR